MSKKTTYLLGILLTIIVGSFLYWKFCCNCSCKTDKNASTTTASASGASIGASGKWGAMRLEGEGLNYTSNENFNFKNNEFNFQTPLGDSVDMGINQLKMSFEKNPNQKLVITGYCKKDELNTSVFENLGFARANDVKKHLVNQGIASDKLEINGLMDEGMTAKDSIYYGPISYQIDKTEAGTPQEDWAALKSKINATPLTIYFNTNQSALQLSDTERKQIADIQRYLDHVSTAKLLVTGHTDNVGNGDANVKLSKTRAEFLKEKLVINGIDATKIITDGKGPNEPIADNATAEGKAKNRRSVLIIQ